MKAIVEAHLHDEQEGSVLMRLDTGFGEPELRVATDHFETMETKRGKLIAELAAMTKDSEGLTLSQSIRIFAALGMPWL